MSLGPKKNGWNVFCFKEEKKVEKTQFLFFFQKKVGQNHGVDGDWFVVDDNLMMMMMMMMTIFRVVICVF